MHGVLLIAGNHSGKTQPFLQVAGYHRAQIFSFSPQPPHPLSAFPDDGREDPPRDESMRRSSDDPLALRSATIYFADMMLIRTQVKPSSIHGMGLFTVDAVPKGTPIWRFLPGFDHAFSPDQFQALPPLARDHTRWFCFVSKSDGHVILSGDHACFINHSETPNTGAPLNAPTPVTTVALRDLQAGEEITCNYFDYDADTPWKLGLADKHAPLGALPRS